MNWKQELWQTAWAVVLCAQALATLNLLAAIEAALPRASSVPADVRPPEAISSMEAVEP